MGIQHLHRRCAAREHRPLVDVALVGDLPGICIGRGIHHHGPRGALRRPRTGIAARAHHGLQQVPAKKKRFGKDPFTGEERWFPAKPASVKIKTRALKKLKDATA